VKYVTTDLPNAIADGIIGKVKDLLPQSIKDIFADLQTGEVKPSDQDVECDEEDYKTRYEPSPLHNQIEELHKRLGPERAAALQLLASKLSVPKDQELTAEMLNQLGEQLSKVSPEQLQKYTESYPAGAAGVPADVSKFVEDLDKTGGAAGTPAAPPPSAPQPAAPTAPPGTGGRDDTTPLNKQQGTPGGTTDTTPQKPGEESKGGESGGMSVVDGRTRIIEATSTVDLPDVLGRVANPDWSHHTGDEPLIHVLVYWKGEAKVLIRNVETKVGNRHWVPPEAKSEAEAVGMLTPYRTKHGYRISEIPNALIPKNIELKGLLFTPQGEAALKKLRAEKAAESAKK